MSRSNLVGSGFLVALACGWIACDAPATSMPEEDASVGVDASDAGSSPQGLFGPCASDAGCEPGLSCATSFPGRFCTHDCASDDECGDEGYCAVEGCVPRCRSGLGDCDRVGGACLVSDLGSFCRPACGAVDISTSTCTGELICDPQSGECTATPASGGGDVGAPCDSRDDCLSTQCYPETFEGEATGFVGGLCFAITRSRGPDAPAERSSCPEGSVTTPGDPEGDTVLCFPECRAHSDCRPGYVCQIQSGAPVGFCVPGCDYPGVADCPAGTRCDHSGSYRRCVACIPACSGRTCGPDGCGGVCGTCADSATCTTAGTCECVAESDAELCAAAEAACGSVTVTDRCGVTRTPACGDCVAPSSCGALAPNQCDCVPESDADFCTAAGATCGALSANDHCGVPRTASCGGCTAPETCGAVAPNRCGCVGETVGELCTAAGASCGTISVTDRCGVGRSVGCGTCAAPATCGGAGVANACGCAPSCVGRVCGSDGCGGSCGSCPSGERCRASGAACEPIPCDPVANTLCGAGQKCEWNGSSTSCVTAGTGLAGTSCFNTTHCAAEHACTTEDFCREYCTSSSHCRTGRCAFDATGTSYGLCSRPCDPVWGVASDGCADFGERCRLLDTSRATEVTDCGPRGTGTSGSTCATTASCGDGLACISSRCRRVCTPGTTCSTGVCASVPGWITYGVCPP